MDLCEFIVLFIMLIYSVILIYNTEWAAFMTILQPSSRSFGVHGLTLITMHLIKAYGKEK